ncbi:Ca2+-binding RTX toxin-like protein [Aliiruegeria haliotis]|uniref:Ca2+-binding RTX toxin-like protein n=1 Tax=Aliiruegeria haliotis TaxID=1280846 RepID=A0A2T0RZF9_9RHOB|nr:Calx-beta domain-containing protein [Aliiruegeria haliotis]PRY26433.1 Ca2+-binding RTX toxin-like protein [Aliiruegeria haliotis]
MSRATAFLPLDMRDIPIWGNIVQSTPGRIVVVEGAIRAEYTGSFRVAPGGAISGTISGYEHRQGSTKTVSVAGLAAEAAGVFDALDQRQVSAAQQLLFNGADRITGSAGSDWLAGHGGKDTIDGGARNDRLHGGNGPDRLNGGAGADTLFGDKGNDALTGGAGSDRMTGGAGADRLSGGNGSDVLQGSSGRDELSGGRGRDRLLGGSGNDALFGNNGNDRLKGGAGNDRITGGTGADNIVGGIGKDRLFGSAGADELSGGSGADRLTGQKGDDQLSGERHDDVLSGGAGNDRLWGGAGKDRLKGDAGKDRLWGGRENDHLRGGNGADRLKGEAGADRLFGNKGNDALFGGAGNDRLVGGPGADRLNGGLGADWVSGSGGKDRLVGKSGDDELHGGRGRDFLLGGAGNDTMFGGAGNDTYSVNAPDDQVSETSRDGIDDGGIDTVKSSIAYTLGAFVEKLYLTGTAAIDGTGNTLNNTLMGNGAANTLIGGDGNDTLHGQAGDDTLLGGADNDHLVGGEGADRLDGGKGADKLFGSEGTDRLYAKAGDDVLYGGDGYDVINGGQGRDHMFGGAGDDTYTVDDPGDSVSEETSAGTDDGGVDTVKSSIGFALGAHVEKLQLTGSDAIDGAGNALGNVIKGNAGANNLYGGGGRDTISGFAGGDILLGGPGRDYLYGGGGSDTFVLRPETGAWDRIYDLAGEDRLGIYASDFGLSDGAGLVGDALAQGYFVKGTSATASGHGQFLYRADKSELLWDSDGTGPASALRIALMQSGAQVNAAKFVALGQGASVSVAAAESRPQGEDVGTAYFTLNLAQPLSSNVVLTCSTVDGSARASDGDFVGLSGEQHVLKAGLTTAYVPVTLLNDEKQERIEDFSLRIDSARIVGSGESVDIGTGKATMSIRDEAPEVVAEYNTTPRGMTDPSGIAYDPSSKSLVMVDSEVEEKPFFQPNNFFSLSLGGDLKSSRALSFTDEPTGLTINPRTGLAFITDDDENKVYVTDPARPNELKWQFSTAPLGGFDAEDIAFDSVAGTLFIVNGVDRKIIEVDQRGKDVIDTFVLAPEITDPEALAYDSDEEVFYVGGGFSDKIWMLDREGSILDIITVLEGARSQDLNRRVNVKDIEIAPASDGSGEKHLYVADYGWTHRADGRLIEIAPGDADLF